MADFGLGSQGTGRVEAWENWNNSYQVSMHYKLSAWIGSAMNMVGDASWSGNIGGGHVGSGNWTYNGGGWRTLREFDVTFNKDANGNIGIGVHGYVNGANAPYVGAGQASWTHYPARIGVAPSIYGNLCDTITNTSARIGTEINNYGLGTSAATRMYYKLTTSGGWTWSTPDQGDVGGYNTWTIGSLTPNTSYNYFSRWWNNNGDTADSGVGTFKTLASGGVTGVTNLKYNKATINIGMNASGSGEPNATVKVQYKRSVDSTWLDSSTSTSLTPAITLTGLKPNTVYDYRVVATNSTGTWTGSTATFKTKNAPGFIFILEDY